jgi:uncharacterized protein (DUF1501 family)
METTRRLFLKSGAVAVALGRPGSRVGTSVFARLQFSRPSLFATVTRAGGGRKCYDLPFLTRRGRWSVDGGAACDANYYQHRSVNGGIAIPRNGDARRGRSRWSFWFAIRRWPGLKYRSEDQGHLAAIHACGLANPTRSHFDAHDYLESWPARQ